MNKYQTLEEIHRSKIVAVVRAANEEQAVQIAKACLAGGITCIEVTFTVPFAHLVIRRLKREFSERELLIGAGTVLDAETARIAILEGADFVVAPSFQKEAAKLCNRYQIPYMPGCMTVGEIQKAAEYGVELMKLFPGNQMGPGFIKAVKGPMPKLEFMPTGGVDLDNLAEWLQAGAFAVGIGSKLTAPANQENFDEITHLASLYVDEAKKAMKE